MLRLSRPALAIATLALQFQLHAQSSARLPVVAGNGLVNVLVEADGSVKTWGSPASMDPSPSLGDGVKPQNTPVVKAPRLLAGVTDVVDASVAVSHVLLLKRDGSVVAWGENDSCELGNGAGKAAYAPVPVPGLRDVRQIAAASFTSAALLADGTVWLWGQWNRDCLKLPKKLEGLTAVSRIAIDGDSVLALRNDGSVWAWGKNSDGAFCDGTKNARSVPAKIDGIDGATDVALDGNSIIVLGDGTVRMCGRNNDGALGDRSPNVKEHLTPFKVPGLTTVRSAKTSATTTIVQLADGTLRAWGNGYYGVLGDGHGDQWSAVPKAPIGLGPVLAHYLSGTASYAIRPDGTVMTWAIPAPPGGPTEFLLKPAPASFSVKLH